ncbi:hypothetical protein D3C85_930040 [compost metagenome]
MLCLHRITQGYVALVLECVPVGIDKVALQGQVSIAVLVQAADLGQILEGWIIQVQVQLLHAEGRIRIEAFQARLNLGAEGVECRVVRALVQPNVEFQYPWLVGRLHQVFPDQLVVSFLQLDNAELGEKQSISDVVPTLVEGHYRWQLRGVNP